MYNKEYLNINGNDYASEAGDYAWQKTDRECEQGYPGFEYKLNTVSSSRGDY